MRQLKHQLILLGVLCAPGIIFAQTKNRISFQTGLVHCFFDGSPIMNFRYPSTAHKPFNGLLLNSLGISYQRKIGLQNFLNLEYNSFRESYRKHSNTYPITEPLVYQRLFSTVKINFIRTIKVTDRWQFLYGGGICYRGGSEVIIVNRGILGYHNGNPIYELNLVNVSRNDLGLNVFGGIEYTPRTWLTFYSKIDFFGLVYINPTDSQEKLKNVYDSPQYPSRYDLSLKFGIGFNF
jgi:hypothetical protein